MAEYAVPFSIGFAVGFIVVTAILSVIGERNDRKEYRKGRMDAEQEMKARRPHPYTDLPDPVLTQYDQKRIIEEVLSLISSVQPIKNPDKGSFTTTLIPEPRKHGEAIPPDVPGATDAPFGHFNR